MQPMQLSDYGMSRERGFLSPYEIDEVFMPTRFDAVAGGVNETGIVGTEEMGMTAQTARTYV